MKKAFGWSISVLGVSCLVFFCGMFFGRRSIDAPSNHATATTSAAVHSDAVALININTADTETLQQLPGIGQTLALRIIVYRDQHGPFTDIRQLSLVEGIGDSKMANIIELICVED